MKLLSSWLKRKRTLVVCGGQEKLGKVTMSEVKRSNESQSSLKMTRCQVDRMVYRYAERKELNNADRCILGNNRGGWYVWSHCDKAGV